MPWWCWIIVVLGTLVVAMLWAQRQARRQTVQMILREAAIHRVVLKDHSVVVSRLWPFVLEIEYGILVADNQDPERVEQLLRKIWEHLDRRYDIED